MPVITLSIVTYNSEKHIKKVIDSIIDGMTPINVMGDNALMCNISEDAGEILPDYKIIVIDNASTDNTIRLVKEAQTEYPGLIECLPQKSNRGFGAGHNRALSLMKSQYHVVINPDIIVPSGALLEMITFMNERNDIGLLTPKILFPDGRLQYLCKHNPTFRDLFMRLVFKNHCRKRQDWFEMRETNYDKEFFVEYASGCFMFFRTEVYLQIHGFDEKFFLYLEDADITRRVNEVSKTLFVPQIHVFHEWQRDQHKKISLMLVNLQSWLHYALKWR